MAEPTFDASGPDAAERMAAVKSYHILDTPAEPGFDDIVLLASHICATPVALVSLVTGNRQWFKARIGTDLCETPLDQAICRHALMRPGLLVIPDLTADARTRDNVLVTGSPHVRFYAGARLETPAGVPLGTLCVIDVSARPEGLTPAQAGALEALARQVMTQLELRRTAIARDEALKAARRANLRRRHIIESATDYAIIASDDDGTITEWSAGAEHVFGWSADEMLGQTAERLFTPEDRASGRIERRMRRALEVGRGEDEGWYLRKNGSRFWANGETMPLRDDGGQHFGFIKIVRDETMWREAAEKLRLSEDFLQSVLASSEDCIQVLDLEGNLIFMNEGGQQAMDVADFEAIRGRAWPVACPDDLRPIARNAVAVALAGGTGHYQGATDTFAGTPKWWDVRITPIRDADGQTDKLLAISRDITAARQAEAKLREAHALNSLILNSGVDCTVVLDLEGQTLHVSPGGIEAMEISDVGSIIGLSWLRVWQGADNEAARNAIAAARAGGTGRFQGFCPTHRGTPKWWDVMITPLLGHDGVPERLVSVGRDITASRQVSEKLVQSQERLNLALGASGTIGIWDWDLKADVIYADANYARLYDVDAERGAQGVPGSDYTRRVHPEDRAVFDAALDRLLAGTEDFSHEYRVLQPDGSVRWVLARGRLVRDRDGTPLRFPGASVDITERKRSEARRLALLELGDRLRDLTDPTEMAVTAAATMGRTLGVTRAGYGTVHLGGEQVTIARDWTLPGTASTAGTHRFRDFGSFEEALKQGATVVIDDTVTDVRTADKVAALDAIGVRSIINLPLFEHGRLVALFYLHHDRPMNWGAEQIAFVRNVADRTRAAIERRLAEERLRDLNLDLERRVEERTRERDRVWTNSQDLLVIIDRQGVFRAVSPAASRTLGWSPEEMTGLTFFDFLHPDDVAAAGNSLSSPKGEQLPVYLNRYRRKDGGYRWISWVAAPEEDLIYAYGRDVTAEKEKTEALQLAEEQLRQSQKMEAVGQLTGGVAHDFNNLLTVIRSAVDMLMRSNLSEDRRRRYIEAISDTTSRAAKLTGQLLAFARRQALKPEVFDVRESVKTIGEMVRTLTGSRIDIVMQVPDEPCFVSADPSQFDTAIVNVAVNARDAMDGEGRLTIMVRATTTIPATRAHEAIQGDYVAVSLSDTGGGIPADRLDQIFEPFFTTKGVGKGTGLGLSQVFGFAKQSGGDIHVASQVGKGTAFTLYLPHVSAPAQRTVVSAAEPPIDGHGTCILVVEDNLDVGAFATQALAELGYGTVWAANAEEALSELAKNADRFDVVFSDVIMPGVSGIDLAQQIRRQYRDLPVVLTSGYSHVLAQNGTFGFELLHKPYSVEELSRVLYKAAGWQRRTRALAS